MKKYILISLAILGLNSCTKDFLDRQPLSELTVDTYYKTSQDALSATLAMYSVLQGPRFYGKAYYNFLEIASDDATNKVQPDAVDIFQWSGVQGAPGSGDFEALWAVCFEGIYRTNLVLENVPKIQMADSSKSKMLAEARFLRALYYWHVVNLYGDVPIITTVAKGIDELYIERSPVSEVYKLIHSDLDAAIAGLPFDWDAGNLGRATKYAAYALKGKCHLYRKEYSEAIVNFNQIINSGRFKLMPKFENIFSPEYENDRSTESIFEIQYGERGPWPPINGFFTDGGTAGEGSQRSLVMGGQSIGLQRNFGEVIATNDLFQEFELGDPRFRETIYYPFDWSGKIKPDTMSAYDGDGNQTFELYRTVYLDAVRVGQRQSERLSFFHIKKAVFGYVGIGTTLNDPTNWRMIRYADVLLMQAEALAERGDLTDAINLLNSLRVARREGKTKDIISITTVAGNVDTLFTDVLLEYPYYATGLSGREFNFIDVNLETFRAALVHERRVELAFEYHRFLDMKRWDDIPGHPGAASVVFTSKANPADNKNYIKGVHDRCPIPQYQIDLSKGSLTQNPGY